MDNFNERIKYFQSLKKQEPASPATRTSTQRTASKLKIPSIFISSETNQVTTTLKEEPKIINKLLLSNLDKNISLSVGDNLDLLDSEPKPITKSRSQEVISFKKVNDDIIEPEENTEKRSSGGLHKSKGFEDLSAELDKEPTGLHKSKGFEDLPLATFENESIVPNDQLLTPMEEQLQEKPRVLNIVPKKIDLILTDDTNIELRKKVNPIKSDRTQSLIEGQKKTSHQNNAEKLFIEKLNEIRSKRRSAEFNTPRTFVFNFTKTNDEISKSVNNLSTISDEKLGNTKAFHKSSDDILLEVAEQELIEQPVIVEKKTKGLKTIPKEIRMRSMVEEEINSSEVLLRKDLKPTVDEVTDEEQQQPHFINDQTSSIVEEETKTSEISPTLQVTLASTENDKCFQGDEEIMFHFDRNLQLLSEPKEEIESPPTPAPRKVSSPAFAQNEEYMTGDDLKQMVCEDESSNVVENILCMSSDELNQETANAESDLNEEVKLSVPVPAPRRRPLSNIENV